MIVFSLTILYSFVCIPSILNSTTFIVIIFVNAPLFHYVKLTHYHVLIKIATIVLWPANLQYKIDYN